MVKLQEAETQIVIDYEVYNRRPSDADLLIPAIEAHQAKLGRPPRLVAAPPSGRRLAPGLVGRHREVHGVGPGHGAAFVGGVDAHDLLGAVVVHERAVVDQEDHLRGGQADALVALGRRRVLFCRNQRPADVRVSGSDLLQDLLLGLLPATSTGGRVC
jgi:hypothetical protein